MVARIILFFLLVFTAMRATAGNQGAWKALIIGIGDYQDRRVTDLRTPVADGRDLAKILSERYGFEIITLFDREATWNNIDTALRKLIAEITEDDSVLIYYGGHGDLDEKLGEGWWYPVDAVPGKRQTYMQNSDLRELIQRMPAKHVLLVSDSCFAGSLFGGRALYHITPCTGGQYRARADHDSRSGKSGVQQGYCAVDNGGPG